MTETERASQTLKSRLGRAGNAYLDVVRSPRYFPLWLGQLVSNFGDTLHYIAIVVLVYQLTGQGVAVAALVAAEILPVLLLGPVAGVVIDRFSRKSRSGSTAKARARLTRWASPPERVRAFCEARWPTPNCSSHVLARCSESRFPTPRKRRPLAAFEAPRLIPTI